MQLSYVFLFLCVPFYFVLNKFINQKIKLFIVPVILFYLPASFIVTSLLLHSGTGSFFTIYLLAIINCIAIIILISLIEIAANLNDVDKAFLYFWLYFMFISFIFGNELISGIEKMVALIVFISGLTCGKFILQNRLERKAFNFLSLSGLLCAYLYWKLYLPDLETRLHYYLLGLRDEGMLNPNVAALLCLPFIVSGLISTFIVPNKFAFKMIGLSSCISNLYVLFLTGSRNGFYAAVVCVIVLIAYNNNKMNFKKILLIPLLIAMFYASVYYLLPSIDNRILQILLKPKTAHLSGREEIWTYFLDKMDFVNYIFGSGGAIEPSTNQLSNMHSMYIQIFYESGIIGSILFLLFVGKFLFISLKIGKPAIIALCIFTMVLASGGAESYPLRGFSIINFMWGISVGLLPVMTYDLTTEGDIETDQFFVSDQEILKIPDRT